MYTFITYKKLTRVLVIVLLVEKELARSCKNSHWLAHLNFNAFQYLMVSFCTSLLIC